jgi:hypothetical protein
LRGGSHVGDLFREAGNKTVRRHFGHTGWKKEYEYRTCNNTEKRARQYFFHCPHSYEARQECR